MTKGQLPQRAGSLGLTAVGLTPRYPRTRGEKKTLMPSVFTENSISDLEDWLRMFNNYCVFGKPNALALFKMLMDGGSNVWMESLPNDVVAN